jgi:hypothetical protein
MRSRTHVNTSDTVSDMPKPPMVMRSIRVPLRLWEQAKTKADREEKDLSQVVRELLEEYVRR